MNFSFPILCILDVRSMHPGGIGRGFVLKWCCILRLWFESFIRFFFFFFFSTTSSRLRCSLDAQLSIVPGQLPISTLSWGTARQAVSQSVTWLVDPHPRAEWIRLVWRAGEFLMETTRWTLHGQRSPIALADRGWWLLSGLYLFIHIIAHWPQICWLFVSDLTMTSTLEGAPEFSTENFTFDVFPWLGHGRQRGWRVDDVLTLLDFIKVDDKMRSWSQFWSWFADIFVSQRTACYLRRRSAGK